MANDEPKNKAAALGIDIGGTKTLCLLVNKQREVIETIKFKTAPREGCDVFKKSLGFAVKSLQKQSREKGLKLVAAGVGCAGTIDRKRGLIKSSPNLLCLEGFAISEFLRKALNLEIFLENDVRAGISAEHKLGAARECSNVLGVFFGTGVGGAAIINNKIYRGASGVGGQVGGILAQPVGGPKAALSHGILDRIASKAAIAGEALVLAVKEWAPYLHKKVGTDLSKVTWGAIKKSIEKGDERVDEMLRARMKVVGIALSNVVNFLNPEMVVMGGGLMDEMPDLVLEEVEAGLREYLSPEVSEALKVKRAALGGEAVALGAANEALEDFEENA